MFADRIEYLQSKQAFNDALVDFHALSACVKLRGLTVANAANLVQRAAHTKIKTSPN